MANFTGKSGPPRKPSKLKLLHGTFRADTVAQNEADPEACLFPAPEHLSEKAKIEWAYISQELFTLGLLTRIDRVELELYCESYATWLEAKAMCATSEGKDRKVIKAADGRFQKNPYFNIMREAGADAHRYLTEFGMTPASRSRINVLTSESAPGEKKKEASKGFA